jgi:hypothetical protein
LALVRTTFSRGHIFSVTQKLTRVKVLIAKLTTKSSTVVLLKCSVKMSDKDQREKPDDGKKKKHRDKGDKPPKAVPKPTAAAPATDVDPTHRKHSRTPVSSGGKKSSRDRPSASAQPSAPPAPIEQVITISPVRKIQWILCYCLISDQLISSVNTDRFGTRNLRRSFRPYHRTMSRSILDRRRLLRPGRRN